MWEKEVVSAASYLLSSEDDQVKGAVTAPRGKEREGLLHQAQSIGEKYGLSDDLLPIRCASSAQHKALLKEID